jgi:lysozyme
LKFVLLCGLLVFLGKEISTGEPLKSTIEAKIELEYIMEKTLSENGIELLKKLEGFRSKMYLDSAGLPTIGYGTLIDSEHEKWMLTAEISKDKATELLKKDLERFEIAIRDTVKVDLTQDQYDALVLFTYNVGEGNFRRSTLLKRINSKAGREDIKAQFLRWVNAGGKRIEGLVKRRTAEIELFFKDHGI